MTGRSALGFQNNKRIFAEKQNVFLMRLFKFVCVAFATLSFSLACQKEKPEEAEEKDTAVEVDTRDALCGTGWLAKAPAVWDGDGGVVGHGDYYLYFLDGGVCIMHTIVAYGPMSVFPIGMIAHGSYSLSSSPGVEAQHLSITLSGDLSGDLEGEYTPGSKSLVLKAKDKKFRGHLDQMVFTGL